MGGPIGGTLTATIINRGWDGVTRDRHNDKVIANLDAFELEGCHLQQLTTDETSVARDSVDTLWILFTDPLPEGRTIGPLDRVQLDAAAAHVHGDEGPYYYRATFELEGNPDQLDDLTGGVHHLELVIRRIHL